MSLQTQPAKFTIRPAEMRDVEAYRDLRLEALRDHPEAFGSDYEQQAVYPITHWQDRLRNNANDPRGIAYLACDDHSLIGMTGIYRNESPKEHHAGTIWGVYVRPGWRAQHVAESLIEACIAWGNTQGVWLVKLAVVTTNIPAIRCYLRCGFSVYGIDPAVIYSGGVYHDEFLMARRLQIPG